MGKYDDLLADLPKPSGGGKYDDILAGLPKSGTPDPMASSTPYQDIWKQPDVGIGKKAWESMTVPSATASKLMNLIASKVPEGEVTGNLPADIARGAPRIVANTLAQVIPDAVSRGSMLTMGAAKGIKTISPLIQSLGRGIGSQVESVAGTAPGALRAAWNDPTLIFAPGKEAAGPLYEAGKTGGKLAENIRNIPLKSDFISVASDLADKGKLPPEAALEARKITGKLLNKGGGQYTEDYLRTLKDKFDTIAKSNENLAAGDVMYKRGVLGGSLRNIVPQNKGGGASTFKMGIMTALENMGLPGKVGLAAMSPMAAGATATAGGVASRVVGPIVTNPKAILALKLLKDAISNEGQQ